LTQEEGPEDSERKTSKLRFDRSMTQTNLIGILFGIVSKVAAIYLGLTANNLSRLLPISKSSALTEL
jgi:hypothetical protein